MLAVGSRVAGLRILDVVGAGGMGIVYRAFDDELDRHVAVKVISAELARDPIFQERFRRELQTAASLEHPHICPVYRAGADDGDLFVVMRFVEGEDLARRIASSGPLEADAVVSVVRQLAAALDYAHARGLVHRDVKPENVLCDHDGNVYLTDFGLAAQATAGDGLEVGGTLAYLAPERCEGQEAGTASDQYSLGCLAYALLVGEPPFVREHEAALLYAHLREEAPSLGSRDLSRLDPVVRRALAKRPDERYASCGEFAAELQSALHRTEAAETEAWPEALPRPATRFFGRGDDLVDLEALVLDPEVRLVTLTGPGGTGKTRLALQLAAAVGPSFGEGVVWVALAPLGDAAHVLATIADALSVGEEPGSPTEQILRTRLTGVELLLVLDNAEHLLPEIATDVALLRDLRGPTVLVTSRERLDLQAEHVYPVLPLALRDGIALFNDRARYLDRDHDPEDPSIGELCDRLDRLPLAIELAAARVPLYRPARLLEDLTRHLDLLRGARDHEPRHSTLRATIDWSYELLSSEEKRVLLALSVFAGGCRPEAGEEVAATEPGAIESLVDKSLIRRHETNLGPRLSMLQTVREYSHERLEESGELESVRQRHVSWLLAFAKQAEAGLRSSDALRWLDELEADEGNLRAALSWLEQNGRTEDQLALVGRVRSFWYTRGKWSEGLRWAEGALARSSGGPSMARATALRAAAVFATELGDLQTAREYGEQSLAMFRELGDEQGVGWALKGLAILTALSGDHAGAAALFEEAIGVASEAGDQRTVAILTGDLGELAMRQGDYERAIALLEDSLARFRDLDLDVETGWALYNLAFCFLRTGLEADALEAARESLVLSRAAGRTAVLVWDLVAVSSIAARRGMAEAGARLLGAAHEMCTRSGFTLTSPEAELDRETEDSLRRVLDPVRFEAACAEGRSMSTDDAVEHALTVFE